jgi:hypothetical protein
MLARPRKGGPLEGVVEGVVDELVGPDEAGAAWTFSVWVNDPKSGGRSFWVVGERELEPTGFAETVDGRRVPLAAAPVARERRTALFLRLATSLTDSSHAAQVAEQIEETIRDLIGPCRISVEAERHWAQPYNYELEVTVEPLGDPVHALRRLAEEGEDCWLSCRDDGWRCDLWWSRQDDDVGTLFLVSEVHGAEVAFLPWESPARRPETERPLVVVQVTDGYDEPG